MKYRQNAPLKLRPYGAIQICLLLLLLFPVWIVDPLDAALTVIPTVCALNRKPFTKETTAAIYRYGAYTDEQNQSRNSVQSHFRKRGVCFGTNTAPRHSKCWIYYVPNTEFTCQHMSACVSVPHQAYLGRNSSSSNTKPVVLNLFHCWDPLNATDVVWDPQVKIEKVCAPE